MAKARRGLEPRIDYSWRGRAANELRNHVKRLKFHRNELVKLRERITTRLEDADQALGALDRAIAGLEGRDED